MIINTNLFKKIILTLFASTTAATVLNLAFGKTLAYYGIQHNEYLICGISVLITIGTAWFILRKKQK
jgi:hypothetical protein